VDADIRISKERTGTHHIEISDNGPGIPDEFKSEVFRPRKDNMKNTEGIGLYLVKKIANRFGGRVWVEDRVHGDHKKGTSVVITVPSNKQ
jgi:signal transduction histidine kinase